MVNLDKVCVTFYAKLMDRVKEASLQANDQETKSTIQWFMNKPKLIQLYKILDMKTDNLSMQNQVIDIFNTFDMSVDRSVKISLPQ